MTSERTYAFFCQHKKCMISTGILAAVKTVYMVRYVVTTKNVIFFRNDYWSNERLFAALEKEMGILLGFWTHERHKDGHHCLNLVKVAV